MSEKRRGLGRGLGALIPTGLDTPRSTGDRPVDVFFPDNRKTTPDPTQVPEAAPAPSAASVTAPAPTDVLVSEPAVTEAAPSDATAGSTTGPASAGETPADDAPTDASSAASATPTSLPDWDSGDVDGLVPVPGARFAELPVDTIRPNPRQPRHVFDEDALAELVGSIREVGVLQPVVVRAVDDGYELIMGERRWRATQEAGLTTIPAIIRETEDSDLLRDALLENLHRSQLNPLEEAAAYQQLLDDFGCTHEQLATRIHRSRPQISNTLRLLRLPPLVQRRVAAGVLSAGHARALLGLSDGAAIERLAQRVVSEGLSVRAVEEIVALGGDEKEPTRRQRPRAGIRNEALDELATRLSDRFETRVKVDLGKTRGKLTVEFASVQDLNRILASLAPEDPGVLKP
ncbi:ParB/RepB/Spo0J family partition protein [Cellulomonas wangsupingiae]|uniref:ParB/RepB/Spo0J family partition protein n=1 Tax=Cellulomonas wangsupingiae TaxID=2968085 RepID=A0ABY5K5V2_9CELL|nr:ParB/RepB/Spo0J family partition protein [Cellulomonas wangsupingiae]MCC2333905.1 ParB/RepB/Spo0J family partition protein [Cellulomonas wangsupingiae]UUI65163.1 ParB/RepB/Spo0J family partition protein [Cellulomonas wangsupingiae]